MTRRLYGAVCLAALCLTPPALAQDPVQRGGGQSGSVVSRVTGEVVRFHAEPAFRPLVLGQDLLAGDYLRTGPQGAVGILFVDRTVLRLHPNSELLVKLVRADAAELDLTAGTLWARAPRGEANVTVNTPSAAAGIRGTDWTLSVEGDGTTRLFVFDGAIELTNPQGGVLARAGDSAVARPGQAPVLVGVANRREAPQMLYTLSPQDAASLLTPLADDLAAGRAENAGALALYRQGLALNGRGEHAAAAQALTQAAPALGPERAAAARWLAAYATLAAGGPFRPPAASTADADAAGAAFAAALAGDLDRAQAALRTVSAPAARAAAVQLAILRDDAALARTEAAALERAAPGSVAALEARAEIALHLDGDAPAAVALLRRAVRLAPERAGLWNALGLAEDAADHPLEAEAAFRRALALEPGGPAQAANLAILLLDQERIAEAKALAESLLARDPQSYLGLRALGRAALQSDDPAATQLLLRALAAQPAAAETSIALAIAAHQSGDATRAAQELDAATRLDPNDAIVPLIRSTLALDAGDVDAAIDSARRAAALIRDQTHVQRSLAADRTAGTPLANAYGAIGLTAWARNAADRAYDPLSPASLFGEAFATGMEIGRGGPSVAGADNAAVQGLMLDPLAASYRLRTTDILRRPFLDAAIGADVAAGDTSDRLLSFQLQGLARVPVPLAYALTLSGVQTPVPGVADPDEFRTGALILGTQISPRARGFAMLGATETSERSEEDAGLGLISFDASDQITRSAALGGSYSLGERRVLTLFASTALRDGDQTARRFALTPASLFQIDIDVATRTRTDFLSLGYKAEDASGTWSAGLEASRLREETDGSTLLTDLIVGTTTLTTSATDETTRAARLYLDRRQRLTDSLTGEALVTVDLRDGASARAGARLGLAWTPAPGHWLRAAALSDGHPGGSSLAPATVLGLAPLDLPYDTDGRLDGVILRYEAELSPRLFLGVEHQNLAPRRLSYATPDALTSLDIDRASLRATSARLDWWVGHGVGVFAGVTHADSEQRDGAFAGAPLPEVPEWTATLGIAWLTRQQFSGTVQGVWTSERFSGGAAPLPAVFTVDAGVAWQPLDRRIALRLDAANIFEQPVGRPFGQAASGREIRLSVEARF
ncbi:TonB-dependent receptor domain-containing protein [Pseudooceanicola sp.]|uniref:TonB-dependent receptor domain-containing protein n=1 Tax=Pseudooceanicola sp. TaxID=1914328 RepID=UPI004059F30E